MYYYVFSRVRHYAMLIIVIMYSHMRLLGHLRNKHYEIFSIHILCFIFSCYCSSEAPPKITWRNKKWIVLSKRICGNQLYSLRQRTDGEREKISKKKETMWLSFCFTTIDHTSYIIVQHTVRQPHSRTVHRHYLSSECQIIWLLLLLFRWSASVFISHVSWADLCCIHGRERLTHRHS